MNKEFLNSEEWRNADKSTKSIIPVLYFNAENSLSIKIDQTKIGELSGISRRTIIRAFTYLKDLSVVKSLEKIPRKIGGYRIKITLNEKTPHDVNFNFDIISKGIWSKLKSNSKLIYLSLLSNSIEYNNSNVCVLEKGKISNCAGISCNYFNESFSQLHSFGLIEYEPEDRYSRKVDFSEYKDCEYIVILKEIKTKIDVSKSLPVFSRIKQNKKQTLKKKDYQPHYIKNNFTSDNEGSYIVSQMPNNAFHTSKEHIISCKNDLIDNDYAVYFLIKGGEIVYIGQSNEILTRVNVHRRDKDFDSFSYIIVDKGTVNEIEMMYINYFNPKYNRLKKDILI